MHFFSYCIDKQHSLEQAYAYVNIQLFYFTMICDSADQLFVGVPIVCMSFGFCPDPEVIIFFHAQLK